MKRISAATTTLAAAPVLFGAFTSAAFARNPSTVVTVSHDSVVRARTHPAGRHVIRRGTSSDARLLAATSLSSDARPAVVTTPVERDAPLAQDALTSTNVGATFLTTAIEERGAAKTPALLASRQR